MRLLTFLLLVLAGCFQGGQALAHEVRPAYLEIVEQEPGHWQITWKQPVMGDKALKIVPSLSNGWLDRKASGEDLTGTHYLRRWDVKGAASEIDGSELAVSGLEGSITEVLVHLRKVGGEGTDTVLKSDTPNMVLHFDGAGALAVPAYFRLGVHHILIGIDHLLFVLGLVLLVGINWRLLGAITSFTVAHTLTLGASALGVVRAPVAVIEALVALSIVYVAFELVRAHDGKGRDLSARSPWIIALAFGLLHGFAFAGALAETGLPDDAIPLSLLLFNLGVEAGQLIFVAAVLLLAMAWRRLAAGEAAQGIARFAMAKLVPYAMGCYASFLFFERMAIAFA